jgi:LDH2 family malate/lactate/ureidoglycolate dehydrogenase
VRVDAGGALLAFERALPLLVEKARRSGIAALAINRCVHFSALFADIEPLTDAGLVGLACTPGHAWVAPAGGSLPLFGTNPVAFGWPRGISRRLFLIWPPAWRRAARFSCINVPESVAGRMGD